MARASSRYPTELEMEILKILWEDGPSPVRHVRDTLAPFRDLAYTSVMTVMNIMTRKGYLGRTRDGKSYIYHARIKRQSTVRDMLSDLVNRAFDGSTTAAMLHLLETADINEAELRKLSALIARKAEERKS